MAGPAVNLLLRQGAPCIVSRARRARPQRRTKTRLNHRHHGNEVGEDGSILVLEAQAPGQKDEKEEGVSSPRQPIATALKLSGAFQLDQRRSKRAASFGLQPRST